MIEKENKEEIRLILAAVAMHAILSARTESKYLLADEAFDMADRMLEKAGMVDKEKPADRIPDPVAAGPSTHIDDIPF